MRSTGLELAGAWNFRDVAEDTGIVPGRLFRSSELSALDDDGRNALQRYGITDVADLRSLSEVQRRGPGQVPDGVAIHLLPFHELAAAGTDKAEAPHEHAFEKMMTDKPADEDVAAAAGRFMVEEYRRFPTLPGAHLAVRQVISMLADSRPVIAHCFAGKDRTGFTVATVLGAVGISRDAVLTDFLRSNNAVPQLREGILETIRTRAGQTAEVVTFAEARLTEEVLGVREDYLDTALGVVDAEYGSAANYLAAIGVTDDQLTRLRSVLRG
ncbi:phosphotyrosine protein phosphatase [Mycobacterium sp. CBMA 234]|uniref:tyrosine-protein phosphatase n=1 Tax=Mycolicibacterium sp. CBMA 234 TaxID=1918495 RepID=UPI0012DCD086|nr:tyrosine-protein phosphatase [Mycolicibacterium sp. CBMA 234]MUL67364.1 phosphotyrosine protein phosphatase [Mycolicibacterium sp. CBMA 234]